RKLLVVVQGLGEQPSGMAACAAAGVTERELPAYERALAALARSGMLEERSTSARSGRLEERPAP
ncbi:MAG: mycofactocin biosynthesis chaperone MftB, partial [Solirubrobacteraceae bacterium]